MKVLNDRRRGLLSRLMTIVTILVLIVLVALWFAARSEYGRKYVEKRLTRMVGLPVTIAEMRIGWPYQLVLENVRSEGFEAAGTPGFSLVEARLWRGIKSYHLKLDQMMVRVKESDKDGGWVPVRMARIADLRNSEISDIIRVTKGLRNRLVLKVSSSDISWLDRDGSEIAFARDVDFRMIPVKVDERRFYYYYLGIYNSSGTKFSGRRDLCLEWLSTGTVDYVVLPGAQVDEVPAESNKSVGEAVEKAVDEVVEKVDAEDVPAAESVKVAESAAGGQPAPPVVNDASPEKPVAEKTGETE